MLSYPSYAIKKILMINGDNTIMLPEECYVNDVINYENHIPGRKYDNINNEYIRLYVDSVDDFLNCKNKDKITHLTFCDDFNQVIDDVDWKNITHLTFNNYFGKYIGDLILSRPIYVQYDICQDCEIINIIIENHILAKKKSANKAIYILK